MSKLEIELTANTLVRLRQKASEQGLPVADYARAALERLAEPAEEPLRSIMELEGLGAEIWKDENGQLINAQEYVNELRREWDHRP